MGDIAEQVVSAPRSGKPVYFTICAANYLHFAVTLDHSLRQADSSAEFIVFLADEPSRFSKQAQGRLRIIPCRDIGIANYDDMAFKYSILEFNTSVKPFCFDYIFDVLKCRSAVYLDPDLFILKPLVDVEAALEGGASCVLTPHATEPVEDGETPDDYSFLRCGGFNLGFIALNSSDEARRYNRWWGEKLSLDCFVALERGVFVDQKYLDLAPSFIEKLSILRHPGYNVAYWNLVQREITESDGQFHANGAPLHFVHFSGISLSDHARFSRHQSRYTRQTLPKDFRRIYDDYFERLGRNNAFSPGETYASAPYAYEHFDNGVLVTPILRRFYNQHRSHADIDNPFAFEPAFFLARSDAAPAYAGVKISRLQYEIWKSRSDLQKAFDLDTREGQVGFVHWAAQSLKREYGLPDVLIEASPVHRAADGAPPTAPGNPDELLRRSLMSRSFMVVNFWRRQLGGKAHVIDHWRRRGYSLSGSTIAMRTAEAAPPPAEGRLNSLAIHGLFQLETGTGQIARGFARAMLAAGHPVSCHNIHMADDRFERRESFPASDSHFSPGTSALICLNADATGQLDHFIPPSALASKRRIGHWVWELAELPDQWLGSLAKVDEVWTPTRFVAEAVRKKTRKPVTVVPYVVDRSEQSSARARSAFGLPLDRLLVLMALDYNSFAARKNPVAGVRAFLDAFDGRGPSSPLLVVKCHGRKRDEAEVKRLIGSNPNIVVIDEVLSDSEMCTLQNACDIFLSAHRAEGFGLNIAECMRLGKLAIATGYSGNEDFMTSSNSIPLPYELVPVGKDEYLFGEGQHWANPRHDDIVDALRWGAHHFDRTAPLRKQARQDITLKFSPEAIGRRMLVALDDR